MAFDSRPAFNDTHWATHLHPFVEVDNRAFPGASNTYILMQLKQALSEYTPDYIVIGFTSWLRLEFRDQTTSSHLGRLSQEQKKLFELYVKHIDYECENWRMFVMSDYILNLAQQAAPTVYSFNMLEHVLTNLKYSLWTPRATLLKNKLVGHEEFEANDPDTRSYHVRNTKVLFDYAQEITNVLTLRK
jgi:hypothetical protein